MLLALEGANGTGKTTTAKLLKERLEASGISVEIIKFPDYGTDTGKIISRYLAGEFEAPDTTIPMQAALYALDRAYNKGKLYAALNRNKVVILDRYVYSNAAIMGAISPKHMDELKTIADMEFTTGHLPVPDYTILIELDQKHLISSMCERKEKRDIHESDDLNLRIAKNYRILAEENYWITIEGVHHDKRRPAENIVGDIVSVLAPCFHRD